jgi:hypothetical protein
MKKRFYESTIALNILIIHNKNNFSFHTPLEKTPGIELPGVFLFLSTTIISVAPAELPRLLKWEHRHRLRPFGEKC